MHLNRKRYRGIIVLLWAALLTISTAFAQNTGSNPYIDSEHTYRITIGDIANTHIWVLADENENPVDTIDISDPRVTNIDAATLSGGNEDITVKFLNSYYPNDTTIYLQYYELADFGSGVVCVSARKLQINITQNTFYFELAVDDSTCNSQSGLLHTYESMDNETFQTTVDFTVTMNKGADFVIDSWTFDVTLELVSSAYTFSSYSVTTDAGGGTVSPLNDNGTGYGSDGDGIFGVTISGPDADNDTQVVATLTVTVEGEARKAEGVRLTVSNGKAVSATDPPSYTDDNTVLSSDRVQRLTVLSVPLTSNITVSD